jgi:hypothetical protein
MKTYKITIWNFQNTVKVMMIQCDDTKQANLYASGLYEGLRENQEVTGKEVERIKIKG